MREFQRVAVRLHILHHAAEEEVHGAWMTEELARHGYDISPGTLYPTLHRLEADGLLTSEQRVVDGRTRRVYAATEAGKEALEVDRHTLRELAREVLGDDLPGRDETTSDSTPAEEGAADAVGGGADCQHRGSRDH
ncbi:PadR family transcriptional regulator [Streptomyces fagopyri]|uniref:PadR family transcriptional regulator n=1 Tax=Streptomyces fagopyri TaxID=2662397 RepID=UPI003F4D38F7